MQKSRAQTFSSSQIMTAVVTHLQIAGSSSWHARYTVLTYLQIMVFYNLFTFMSDQKAVDDVRALVIRLLEDEQLEVKTFHSQPFNMKNTQNVMLRHVVCLQ